MGIPKLKTQKYSYADYLTWPDDERWELIDGVAYDMSPAPFVKHQEIVGNVFFVLKTFLKGKKCTPYISPFDIRFPEMSINDDTIYTVVQPDVLVYCDPSRVDKRGGIGAPDLVVEVLSESTRMKDLTSKLLLFQRSVVKEYWVIDPETDILYQYILDKNGMYYPPNEIKNGGILKCSIFPLEFDTTDIYPPVI